MRIPREYGAVRLAVFLVFSLFGVQQTTAGDWPQWGRDASRNAVSSEKNSPLDFRLPTTDKNEVKTPGRGIAWQAQLGDRTVVAPVVVDGLVWVCTSARDPSVDEDRIPWEKWDGAVLICLRETDGKLLWKHRSPRLYDEGVQDCPGNPLGSVPLIEGDRLWYVNNRSEVVCFDIAPLKKGTGEPREAWKLDMRKELKVFPCVPGPCRFQDQDFTASVAGDKDRLFVVTHNGVDPLYRPRPNLCICLGMCLLDWLFGVKQNEVDESHFKIPAPDAPSVICLEKATGKLLWKDNSPGKNILHCQISSPLVVEVAGLSASDCRARRRLAAELRLGDGQGSLAVRPEPQGRCLEAGRPRHTELYRGDAHPLREPGIYRHGAGCRERRWSGRPLLHRSDERR